VLRKCRASGGKNKVDGDDNGLSVKDMERYLDEFDRYDSVWDTKPAWYVFARAFAFGKFESRKKRRAFLFRKTPRSFVHSGLRQTIKDKSSIVGSQRSNLDIQGRQAYFAGRVCQSILSSCICIC